MQLIHSSLLTRLAGAAVISSSIAQQQDEQEVVRDQQRYLHMTGGVGGSGRGNGMMDMMDGPGGRGSLIDPDTFVDSMCTNPCGLIGESFGVLVCRTIGDRSFSACIDTEESTETDVCGCCKDMRPTVCTSKCDDEDPAGGVLLKTIRRNGSSKYDCVSSLDSVTMQLHANTTCR